MRMTRHNGRTGRDGTFLVKHNDRCFDLTHADHINAELTAQNVYWDIQNGFRFGTDPNQETELIESFEDVEKNFYEENYRDYTEAQNRRNEQAYHAERNQTPEDLRHHKRTCPEETIYQIGKIDDHADPNVLLEVVTEFTNKLTEKYGTRMHILDFALHLDEATPHVHERHVFDAENAYGELVPNQDKALEALGIELPDPSKKKGRYNNRKMTFDASCRDMLFEVAKEHGLMLEEEPEYGGRKHKEKNEYIITQQRKTIEEQKSLIDDLQAIIASKNSKIDSQETEIAQNSDDIAGQEDKLSELSLKVADVESLIDDVAESAYDTAVDVVTEVAFTEVQKEEINIISDYRDWILQPEREAPIGTRTYTAKRMDAVINKIKKTATQILSKVIEALKSPKQREEGIAKVKERTRESVLKKLSKHKHEVNKREHDHHEFMRVIENEHTL